MIQTTFFGDASGGTRYVCPYWGEGRVRGERETDLPDAEAHEDHPDYEPAEQPSRDDIFKIHKGLPKILQ
jgi:hypothetical protein